MLIIPEGLVPDLISMEDTIAAVERCCSAFERGEAWPHPVVREVLGYRGAVYGIKSGFDGSRRLLGFKAGGYWPENAAAGLTNHQSTVLLFSAETGRVLALVGGNYLTGARTGAASAIATKHLARDDARVLSIIGTGNQAAYQLDATLVVRRVESVVAWDPSAENLQAFANVVRARGLPFQAVDGPETAARAADILITVTPSQSPIVMKDWVRPGTHINAMGADTIGKQELDPALVAQARLYVDAPDQAVTIGESQHAFAANLIGVTGFAGTLGGLTGGSAAGRASVEEITLFDGTGVALQDLAAAAEVVARAREKGLGTEVDF
jgi:ornithine cyclodeaminase/alanine dehydrogenase-like protein (mu-crystallin family)